MKRWAIRVVCFPFALALSIFYVFVMGTWAMTDKILRWVFDRS